MDGKSFLGKGMKFPPQVNKATGRFEIAEGLESIKESVYLILMTQKTERWVRPNFGSRIMSYTFMDTGTTMLSLVAKELRECIAANEPRIRDVDIKINSEIKKGCLIIGVDYVVRETNTPDNLVFPFYLNAVAEREEDGE